MRCALAPALLASFAALAGCVTQSFHDGQERLPDPTPGRLIRFFPARGMPPDSGALEGRWLVFEDRGVHRGRMLSLRLLFLPATGEAPATEPIFVLAPVPGQAATELAPLYLDSALRESHDLIFLDRRGTAEAHRLGCGSRGGLDPSRTFAPLFQPAELVGCLAELLARADLRFYTTPMAADDLDEVRQVLGYSAMHLLAGNHGAQLALVTMRRHPRNVRCVVLDGVAPLDTPTALYRVERTRDVFLELIDECQADPAAAAVFPDPGGELATVLRRVELQPVVVEIPHPRTSAPLAVELDREAVLEIVRGLLLDPVQARELPLLVRQAVKGDLAPLARRGFEQALFERDDLALGLLCCLFSAEQAPRIPPSVELPTTTGAALGGDARLRALLEIAAFWPPGELPEDYFEPVRSVAPTLILSGASDPLLDPAWAADVARELPKSRHVVLPGGHGVLGPELEPLVLEFLAGYSAAGLDFSALKAVELPPFRLE